MYKSCKLELDKMYSEVELWSKTETLQHTII